MPFDAIVESIDPILVPTQAPLVPDADIQEWPWPRLLVTNNRVLLVVKQPHGRLYVFEMFLENFGGWIGYVVADLGLADDVNFVDIADFGTYYVLSTYPAHKVFARNPLLDTATVDRDMFGINLVNEIAQPLAACCCNYNGQFLGGNIHNWHDLGPNAIIWSAIGAMDFDPFVNRTAGFSSLIAARGDGTLCQIQRLLPLIDGVAVYTNHGQTVLSDSVVGNTFTYGRVPLHGLGILSGNHVAGDEYCHGFIDTNKEFWILEPGAKLQKRGYRDYISKIFETDNEVIVSYIPLRKQWYISAGAHSLVVNSHGAFTVYQAVSSALVGWNGMYYGTFRELNDFAGRVTVDVTDFGSRGLKTLESVEIGASCAEGTTVHASTLWKSHKEKSYQDSRSILTNPLGAARLNVTALEYKITITFSHFAGSDLSSVTANVKYPDARFRRGIAAGQEVTR
jgi:hypothetical protein